MKHGRRGTTKVITRRQALFLGLGAVGGLGTTFFGRLRAQQQYQESLADPKRDFSVTGDLPLGDRALAKGLLYGAAVHTDYLADPDFESILWHECNILVPENELQAKNLRPTPDRFDFSKADRLARLAREHDLQIRGH
ncbi:MAG TPA: endo-1,4-beta-xylanase, partial [Chroococcidiopsis sp.]